MNIQSNKMVFTGSKATKSVLLIRF